MAADKRMVYVVLKSKATATTPATSTSVTHSKVHTSAGVVVGMLSARPSRGHDAPLTHRVNNATDTSRME